MMKTDGTGESRAPAGTSSLEKRVESAVDTMQQQVASSIRPAAERARSFAERQKDLGAEQIGGVARAIHTAAREFETELPQMAKAVHDAAARLDSASTSLRDRSAAELIAAFNGFARSQPAALFGVAVLAGFAASRFLKSTAEETGSMQPERTP